MFAGLKNALASRKKFVDETSEVSSGHGTSLSNDIKSVGSRFIKSSQYFSPKSETGRTGLVNQGATCYLNSLLQTLYMIPEFRCAMFQWIYNEAVHGAPQRCLPLQLQTLFAQMQLSSRGSVDTTALTKSFGWTGVCAHFTEPSQMLLLVLYVDIWSHPSRLVDCRVIFYVCRQKLSNSRM